MSGWTLEGHFPFEMPLFRGHIKLDFGVEWFHMAEHIFVDAGWLRATDGEIMGNHGKAGVLP